MAPSTGAILMVGRGGATHTEQLVQQARYASTLDLIELLKHHHVAPIILSSPSFEWVPPDQLHGVVLEPDPPDRDFHFGRRLASLICKHNLLSVLYFGGGSVPLLQSRELGPIIAQVSSSSSTSAGFGLTNNKHSSDWLALAHADQVIETIAEADRDNGLAWSLDQRADYAMRVPDDWRPAASLDIDAPADLALLSQHPGLQPHLERYLKSASVTTIPVQQVAEVAASEGTNLTIIGRVSPPAWQALNKATLCWTRVFSEERGMVASGRQTRGEVQTLLAAVLRQQGAHAFFQTLASMTDAVIFDNRPLMVASGVWPSASERFASDLYDLEGIENAWLADFTAAAMNAPIPVLLGGHSIVSSGLYVMVEIIERLKA